MIANIVYLLLGGMISAVALVVIAVLYLGGRHDGSPGNDDHDDNSSS